MKAVAGLISLAQAFCLTADCEVVGNSHYIAPIIRTPKEQSFGVR